MAKYAKVEGAERDSLVADDTPGAAAAAAAESSSSSFPWRSELLLLLLGVCAGAALAAVALALPASEADSIEVKVVIVALFDAEAGLWLARGAAGQTLDIRLEFPQGYRCDPCRSAAAGGTAAAAGDGPELYLNAETGVLLVITGMGTAWSAASIMGLGMDARFNLRRAYWLVAGIAGIDPHMGSVGSGAWADWVVEADLAHYIDAREMPADWEHPFFPMRAPGATISAPWGTAPSAVPTDPSFDDSMAVRLDTGLVNWAFALTVDTPLADSAALRASRAPYAGYPQALRPPFVLRGDNADAQTYWSGKLSVEWCRDWVRYWTGGQGTFATSAMEDSGVMRSLRSLDVAGKVDVKRALVLRTASNYAMQPDGVTAAEFYFGDRAPSGALDEGASPFEASLETAWVLANTVAEELVRGWDDHQYATAPPSL